MKAEIETLETAAVIRQAMRAGKTIRFKYRGKPRQAYPMIYGELHKGTLGLLCYIKRAGGKGGYHMAYRMYLADLVTDVQIGSDYHGSLPIFSPGIARNFREIIAPSFVPEKEGAR